MTIDKTQTYELPEAIKLTKENSKVKFDASVEIHLRTGIDPKKGDQQIRSTVALPHGTGKTKTVAAFVGDNDKAEAKDAGADFVYDEQDIEKIAKSGKVEFDVAVSTPEMMPKLAKAAKVLGPKGLMPNPKSGTVTQKVGETIGALKKGTIAFKNDDTANVHAVVGKVSFEDNKLQENIEAFIEAVKKAKPASAKGIYIKSATLSSSMGPGIKIAL